MYPSKFEPTSIHIGRRPLNECKGTNQSFTINRYPPAFSYRRLRIFKMSFVVRRETGNAVVTLACTRFGLPVSQADSEILTFDATRISARLVHDAL